MPKDLEPDERAFHEAFASLRSRVVHVRQGFERALRDRLEDADRPTVGLRGAFAAAMAQLLSLWTGLHAPSERAPLEDPSDDP